MTTLKNIIYSIYLVTLYFVNPDKLDAIVRGTEEEEETYIDLDSYLASIED